VNIPTVVRWLHPPPRRLKLNVDGAFKLTTGGAGGGGFRSMIIRAYGINYALAAKAFALCDGLMICCNKGVVDVMVETDSLNLMQIVTRQTPCPWELSCIIHDMAATTQKIKAKIKHVPREAN
ncbi:hypothetical protein Taro_041799, partial [Colocasia esculenta]|nr:hypothetical protein [Colocasia esculenta]